MPHKATQLAFAFAAEPAFGEESFCVSACNQEAHAWVTRWPEWLSYGLIITGPAACGKTHLARIWQHRAGALALPAAMLSADFSPAAFAQPPRIVVEEADTAPAPQALFHLLNWTREQGGHVLLTSRLPQNAWPFALPDLRSRLGALPSAALAIPDDALLTQLLAKLFSDRQLSVTPEVLHYLASHMERSFGAASDLVVRLDEAAMSAGRAVTLALARTLF